MQGPHRQWREAGLTVKSVTLSLLTVKRLSELAREVKLCAGQTGQDCEYPLLLIDEDAGYLLDGRDSRLCLGCLLDGIHRSRLQRHRYEGTRCEGAGDGWGPVIELAKSLATVPQPRARMLPEVRIISRSTLQVLSVPVAPSERCHCARSVDLDVLELPASGKAVPLQENDPLPYRALDLCEVAREVDGLANPFCSGLGLEAVKDLRLETTAKVSGAYINRTSRGQWSSPWGGHTTKFRTSLAIGILEGLERIAGGTPLGSVEIMRGIASTLEMPAYRPSQFGMAKQLDERPIFWVRALRLSDGAEVAVPRDVAFYLPDQDEQIVQDSSNGCACGGTVNEAVLYGLLEVVERDAFLISWYGGLQLEEINPNSIRTQHSRELMARMRLLGHRVRFFDATVGTRVPVVVAVCENLQSQALCFGAGAHPDAERALASALSEVASDYQVAEIRRERGRKHIEEMLSNYNLVRVMEDHADLFTHPEARPLAGFLLDAERSAMKKLETMTVPGAGRSVEQDLDLCLELLDTDQDVLVVEQTLPTQAALGVRSVKVLLPGLVPIDFGWHRQRALSMARTKERAAAFRDTHRPASGQDEMVLVPHPFP